MDRAIKITYTTDDKAVFDRGHYLAWELWNILCFTFVHHHKYPGKYTVAKTLRKLPQAVDLSDRCFSGTLDQFDIALKSWWSNLKRYKSGKRNSQTEEPPQPPKPSRFPRPLKFQVGRNAKTVGNFQYRLTVLGGKVKDRHALIKVFIKPGVKMSQVKWLDLAPDGTGSAIIEVEQKESPGQGVAAIDLGIVNIATIAFDSGESILVSGKGLKASNQWYNKKAGKCKPANWTKGKKQKRPSKTFRKYRRKAGNIQKLAVHNLTRFIIRECIKRGVGTIVTGDLGGIRDGSDHGKRNNQYLHNWPFYQIVKQLEYKGEEYGIKVKQRSERNTSKLHHLTGEKGIRSPRGLVKFPNAGQIINSDVNGAFGILNNYLDEIGQSKVSPAKVGVGADFPGPPSPSAPARRTGKVSQIEPTFVAKFDLRNWSMKQLRCNTISSASFDP